MSDKKHDTKPENEVDRVIYDYLDTMLSDPAADERVGEGLQTSLPLLMLDNVTPFQRKKAERESPKPLKERMLRAIPGKTKLADKPVALLCETLLRTPPQPEPKEQKARSHSHSQQKIEPQPNSKPEINTKSLRESPATDSESAEPKAKELQPKELQTQERDPGLPHWAEGRFECLIFNVAGLKMAVPLVTLGSIHQIDRKFNTLPGQYDWFIGILQTSNSGNIKVLDTALCVMPERYDPGTRESLEYVITIHGYEWGLACHQVEKSITLEPDQVKWRGQSGKRPWLAGTVVEHMCSLIDTHGFHEIIQKAEQR